MPARPSLWSVLAVVAALLACVAVPARAAMFALPAEGDLIGEYAEVRATHDDTLIDIARSQGLGYEEVVNANPGVDPWLPGEGTLDFPRAFKAIRDAGFKGPLNLEASISDTDTRDPGEVLTGLRKWLEAQDRSSR